MNVAVFTACLPDWEPAEAVAQLRDLGYDGIEWRVVDQAPAADGRPGFWAGNRCTWPLSTFVADAPRIRALTEGAGLAMPAVGSYAACSEPAAVEQAMRGAALLGAAALRVNVPAYDGAVPYNRLWEQSRAEYRAVAALAREHGVRAMLELHHARLLPSASAAARFLDGFDPSDVGVIHDAGNMVHEGYEQYRLGLETLGPFLGHVHLKNAAWRPAERRADGSLAWRAEWAPLTEGIVDLAALLRALRQVGYDGWLSLEDFSTAQPLAERLRDNLAAVRRALGEGSDA